MKTLELAQAGAASVSLLLLVFLGYETATLAAAAVACTLFGASFTVRRSRGSG